MPKKPDFEANLPTTMFFLGGVPSLALIAVYGVGAIHASRYGATVGNIRIGQRRWPMGGLRIRGLIEIEENIVKPNTKHPCYAELQSFIDKIVTRYPVRLYPVDKKGLVNPAHLRTPDYQQPKPGEFFGSWASGFILPYLAVVGGATRRILFDEFGISLMAVKNTTDRYRNVGAIRMIGPGINGVPYWALDPNFFAHDELKALLLRIAQTYRPDFYPRARKVQNAFPEIERYLEEMQRLYAQNSLPAQTGILSIDKHFLPKRQ